MTAPGVHDPKTCDKCGRTRSYKSMRPVPGGYWCASNNSCRKARKAARHG